MSTERRPPVSININTVRAKDGERDRLQAHLDAFLRKRGNKVQVLDSHELGKGYQIEYREMSSAMAQARLKTRERRRRSQDEEE